MDKKAMVAALYEEYDYMHNEMLPDILAVTEEQENLSRRLESTISILTERMQENYLAALDNYRKMQNSSPEGKKAMVSCDTEKMSDDPVSELLDETWAIVLTYCERRKNLALLDYLVDVVDGERGITLDCLRRIHECRGAMRGLCRGALSAFCGKKDELKKFGTSPRMFFDREILKMIKDMDMQNSASFCTYCKDLHLLS